MGKIADQRREMARLLGRHITSMSAQIGNQMTAVAKYRPKYMAFGDPVVPSRKEALERRPFEAAPITGLWYKPRIYVPKAAIKEKEKLIESTGARRQQQPVQDATTSIHRLVREAVASELRRTSVNSGHTRKRPAPRKPPRPTRGKSGSGRGTRAIATVLSPLTREMRARRLKQQKKMTSLNRMYSGRPSRGGRGRR